MPKNVRPVEQNSPEPIVSLALTAGDRDAITDATTELRGVQALLVCVSEGLDASEPSADGLAVLASAIERNVDAIDRVFATAETRGQS